LEIFDKYSFVVYDYKDEWLRKRAFAIKLLRLDFGEKK